MAEIQEKELIVIGGGPGGYTAAFTAAAKGIKTTILEESSKLGGTCLNVGCIPSKALLHAAKLITDAEEAKKFGLIFAPPQIDLTKLREAEFGIVRMMNGGLAQNAKSRGVEVIGSRGVFVDPQTVQLADGAQLRFKHCILATGSSPAVHDSLRLNSPRWMDSTIALKLEEVPKKLLVIGGGYIGLELGYVYAALGSEVTVVEMLDRILIAADPDLVEPLEKRLRKLFRGEFYLGTKVVKLEDTGKVIRVTFEGPKAPKDPVEFDRVLVATGRRANTDGLGLDKAGVQLVEKSRFIKVDESRRTTNPRIYAIGDITGEPMLAHKASYEAKVAVGAIAGEGTVMDVRGIPAVIFTDPEIAWCGITEEEAKRQGRKVKVLKFPWVFSGRATTHHRNEGITKLLIDPDSDRVLGVGIVGVEAGEMIAEAMLALEMGATSRDLELTIHAHPTLAETLMEAAEEAHEGSTHLPRKAAAKT
jgi:dihydrolipoamide dehydrogenase